jgi:hypothetical protein
MYVMNGFKIIPMNQFTSDTESHFHHHHTCHGVGPLVDLFQSHTSRSLFKGLPRHLVDCNAKFSGETHHTAPKFSKYKKE